MRHLCVRRSRRSTREVGSNFPARPLHFPHVMRSGRRAGDRALQSYLLAAAIGCSGPHMPTSRRRSFSRLRVVVWFFRFWMARTPVGIFVPDGSWCSVDSMFSRPAGRARDLTILTMRAVPGQGFAYVDFSRNPNTWFSHESGVNLFVDYPMQPLLVDRDAIPGQSERHFLCRTRCGRRPGPCYHLLAFGLVRPSELGKRPSTSARPTR